jgi:hypothetical protein
MQLKRIISTKSGIKNRILLVPPPPPTYLHLGIAQPFLTSALAGGEYSAIHPGRFTPGERTLGTHWIGGWVGPRAERCGEQ